jgi:hypothetical protein
MGKIGKMVDKFAGAIGPWDVHTDKAPGEASEPSGLRNDIGQKRDKLQAPIPGLSARRAPTNNSEPEDDARRTANVPSSAPPQSSIDSRLALSVASLSSASIESSLHTSIESSSPLPQPQDQSQQLDVARTRYLEYEASANAHVQHAQHVIWQLDKLGSEGVLDGAKVAEFKHHINIGVDHVKKGVGLSKIGLNFKNHEASGRALRPLHDNIVKLADYTKMVEKSITTAEVGQLRGQMIEGYNHLRDEFNSMNESLHSLVDKGNVDKGSMSIKKLIDLAWGIDGGLKEIYAGISKSLADNPSDLASQKNVLARAKNQVTVLEGNIAFAKAEIAKAQKSEPTRADEPIAKMPPGVDRGQTDPSMSGHSAPPDLSLCARPPEGVKSSWGGPAIDLRASQAPVGPRRSRRNGLGLQGEWQRRNDRNSIGVSPQR